MSIINAIAFDEDDKALKAFTFTPGNFKVLTTAYFGWSVWITHSDIGATSSTCVYGNKLIYIGGAPKLYGYLAGFSGNAKEKDTMKLSFDDSQVEYDLRVIGVTPSKFTSVPLVPVQKKMAEMNKNVDMREHKRNVEKARKAAEQEMWDLVNSTISN